MKTLWIGGIVSISMFFSCTYTSSNYLAHYNIGLKQVERPVKAKERYGEQKVIRINEEGIAKYSFEDEMIRVIWIPTAPKLSFVLTNKTDHSIKIVWDEAAFVDQDGMSQRVIHAGVKYIDRNSSQPPTIVVRGGTVNDLIIPSANIYYKKGAYEGWREAPLFPSISATDAKVLKSKTEQYIGKTIQVLLPLQIEDVVNEYIFIFEVQSFKFIYREPSRP